MSVGPRGAQFTAGTSGSRATAGLPGTGLHYTVQNPHKSWFSQEDGESSSKSHEQLHEQPHQQPRPSAVPRPGWFERLSLDKEEKRFIDGWQACETGNIEAAVDKFRAVSPSSDIAADAAWSAAVLLAQRDDIEQAIVSLQQALRLSDRLGKTFESHGFAPKLQVWVTPQIQALMVPTESSVRLFLAELQQSQGRASDALQTLAPVLQAQGMSMPTDPVMLAAFGELAWAVGDNDALHRFNVLAADVGNETPVHTAVLFYRGKWLFEQQLFDAALSVLTLALRRKKDRDPELLLDIRFLRAQAYEALNRRAPARRDFERIYAQAPEYDGIRQALGLA